MLCCVVLCCVQKRGGWFSKAAALKDLKWEEERLRLAVAAMMRDGIMLRKLLWMMSTLCF